MFMQMRYFESHTFEQLDEATQQLEEVSGEQ